ncbi:unnamed protein product [Linum trigynum]|uniref:Uncharacterized protein n=1 Tax=Linum trigynum TaxID=586398 RepID=A0AAV2DGP9_9ROSI
MRSARGVRQSAAGDPARDLDPLLAGNDREMPGRVAGAQQPEPRAQLRASVGGEDHLPPFRPWNVLGSVYLDMVTVLPSE